MKYDTLQGVIPVHLLKAANAIHTVAKFSFVKTWGTLE